MLHVLFIYKSKETISEIMLWWQWIKTCTSPVMMFWCCCDQVIKFIEDGKRLPQPDKCPDVTYKQMLKCWSKEPKLRPSFQQLNAHFEKDNEYVCTRDFMKPIRSWWVKSPDTRGLYACGWNLLDACRPLKKRCSLSRFLQNEIFILLESEAHALYL